MTADRIPSDNALLAPALRAVTRMVTRWPKTVIAVGLLVTLVSVAITTAGLGFRTSRLDLLNPDSSYNQRWLAYLEEFGHDDDVVVVVEGTDTDDVVAALEHLGPRLAREDDFFFDLFYGQDFEALRRKGLHQQPVQMLRQLDTRLAEVQPVVEGQWHRLGVESLLQAAIQRLYPAETAAAAEDSTAGGAGAEEPSEMASLDELRRLLDALLATLEPSPRHQSPWPEMLDLDGEHDEPAPYFLADGGRLGLLLVKLRDDHSPFASTAAPLAKLRQILSEVQQVQPSVKFGLTGMPVLENDEMQVSRDDMLRASGWSLVGVAVLFMAGFGGWRYPLLCVVTLLMGMAWSFAYVTLGVGHLNILSVSFGVILIGLGIDFGVHFVARYMQHRSLAVESRPALIRTAGEVGPGIVTGGVTTAIAFFTAALTQFTGIAELGLIAGGGILLCVIAALTVLPALIQTCDGRGAASRVPTVLPIGDFFEPLSRAPRTSLALGLFPVLLFAGGVSWLHYDHNLLNLQPRQLESVRLERQLIERADQSVWFGLSVAASRDEVRQRKELFEKLDTVERVEEVALLLPATDPDRTRVIARLQARLAHLPDQPPVIPAADPTGVQLAAQHLSAALQHASAPDGTIERRGASLGSKQSSLIAASDSAAALAQRLAEMPREESIRRLTGFQQLAAAELLEHLRAVRDVADPQPPTQDDLPAGLVSRFFGRSGLHLIRVYARGNIWDMERLSAFVRDVEAIDPQITGHPIQTYYASRQMQHSYIHAAIYAALAVAIILMLDFRSVSASLLAMIPVSLGMVQLFGLLGILEISLNPANLIVLPLILGIGIDDGVHVVHDYCRQRGRYRLSNSTATAILITSATTMVGFGCMMIANHQGIRSLGQVLTLGVFCCLVSSLVVLPAVLTLLSWGRETAPVDAALRTASVGGNKTGERDPNAEETAPQSLAIAPRRAQRPAIESYPDAGES